MKVLILSLDRALFDKKGEGDTFKRFLAYKKYCQSLTAIVPVNKKTNIISRKGVSIFPAQGANNLLAYWKLFWLARKIIQEKNIDLAVSNDAVLGAVAIWWRFFYKFKVQVSIFGLEIIDTHWLKERWGNIFIKWISVWAIKRSDSIRTDNKQEKKLLNKYFEIDKEKIFVIPVTPSQKSQNLFSKAKTDYQWRKKILGNKKYLVLSVGSLVKAKDFLSLIKSAKIVVKKNSKIVFVIAGKGPEKKKLEQTIRQNNLNKNVKLIGSVDYHKLPALYASADIFVLSSSHEGFPRVLMEAALTSIPIISTKIDGASEIVEDKVSGLIVPVKSLHKLALAILHLLGNKSLRDRLGEKGKKKAMALLDFKKAVKKTANSWQKTIDEK